MMADGAAMPERPLSSAEARQLLDEHLSEKQFMQLILDAARALGWTAYHTFDARKSAPGFPDLALVKGRRLLFIECKTERGRLRPEQARWLALLGAATEVQALLARPRDWSTISALLSAE